MSLNPLKTANDRTMQKKKTIKNILATSGFCNLKTQFSYKGQAYSWYLIRFTPYQIRETMDMYLGRRYDFLLVMWYKIMSCVMFLLVWCNKFLQCGRLRVATSGYAAHRKGQRKKKVTEGSEALADGEQKTRWNERGKLIPREGIFCNVVQLKT